MSAVWRQLPKGAHPGEWLECLLLSSPSHSGTRPQKGKAIRARGSQRSLNTYVDPSEIKKRLPLIVASTDQSHGGNRGKGGEKGP